jgi:hypothetical protein
MEPKQEKEMLVFPIQQGVRFLSDEEQFGMGLPPKCIFDKGRVGCGGTTIALRNAHDYVITVPFIALIKSKVESELEKGYSICGVYAGITDDQIREYHNSEEVRKYMVTYDSLERLISLIDPASNEPLIDPSKFKLLVDEYHILFTHYGSVNKPFRKKAVQTVLRNYEKFAECCFMSATPLEPDFILEELKEIPLVRANWSNGNPIRVQSVHCKDVDATTCYVIQDFLSGEYEGNAYFFLNSVLSIKFLVEKNGLTEENTRVIYSQNNNTEVGIPRSEVNSTPKKINLLTSAAFEGCDIEDENGKIFIVSDHRNFNTLIDISTSFIQISGRIRNTKYNNEIVHFYSKTRYSDDVTYEDYKAACDEEIKRNQDDVKILNQVSKETRDKLDLKEKSSYISKDPEGLFVYDPNLVKMDLYQFKLTRLLYGSTKKLHLAYLREGFEVEHLRSDFEFSSTESEVTKSKKMSFKDAVLFIKESGLFSSGLRPITDFTVYQLAEDLLRKDPELLEAISSPHIGFDGIERLRFNRQRVRRELIKTQKTSNARKIADLLENNGIQAGFYTNADIKEQLESVFTELGLKGNPVATDIEKYFYVNKAQSSRNAPRLNGYKIIKKRDL